MVRITPLVVINFTKFIVEHLGKDVDPQLIGIDPADPRTVEKFLQEHCMDLTYHECKEKTLEMYRGLLRKTKEEYINEALEYSLQALNYYLETPYVSRAFKIVYDKYKDVYKPFYTILSEPEKTELVFIFDVLIAKYGCEHFDIRPLHELTILGIAPQLITDNIEHNYNMFITYFNLKPSSNRYDFLDEKFTLGIAGYKYNEYLICFIDEKLTPITSSKDPFIVINFKKKKIAIIE